MRWIPITRPEHLLAVNEASREGAVLVFKHSKRCGISSLALDRLERAWKPADDKVFSAFFIDLWAHRDLSDAVAEQYGIEHQSPQALIIDAGKCVFAVSHSAIRYETVVAELERAA